MNEYGQTQAERQRILEKTGTMPTPPSHTNMPPQPTPRLATVSEQASHIAFINGPTFSREEILSSRSLIDELVKALKAQMQMRDMKKPAKLDEAISWRDNDDIANKWALEAIAKAEVTR